MHFCSYTIHWISIMKELFEKICCISLYYLCDDLFLSALSRLVHPCCYAIIAIFVITTHIFFHKNSPIADIGQPFDALMNPL